MTEFKTGWKGKLRDGRSVRVIADDMQVNNEKFLVVIITSSNGDEYAASRSLDGRLQKGTDHPFDLVEEPKIVERWVNIYPDGLGGCLYASEEHAKHTLIGNVLKTIKVVIEY